MDGQKDISNSNFKGRIPKTTATFAMFLLYSFFWDPCEPDLFPEEFMVVFNDCVTGNTVLLFYSY